MLKEKEINPAVSLCVFTFDFGGEDFLLIGFKFLSFSHEIEI